MHTKQHSLNFHFLHILSEADARHRSISIMSVEGRSLSEGSTLFAMTLVARRDFCSDDQNSNKWEIFLHAEYSIILCLGSC